MLYKNLSKIVYNRLMKHHSGFTVIELIFLVVLLGAASILFFVQKNNIEIAARDEQRKIAINAMHYGLEEIYYKEHQNYPRLLDEETLPFVDPEMFVDPNGVKINQSTVTIDETEYPVESNYRYEGKNCDENDTCKAYSLRAVLENEDDFVKTNRQD